MPRLSTSPGIFTACPPPMNSYFRKRTMSPKLPQSLTSGCWTLDSPHDAEDIRLATDADRPADPFDLEPLSSPAER